MARRWVVNEAELGIPVDAAARGPTTVRWFRVRKPRPAHMEKGFAEAFGKSHGVECTLLPGDRWYRFVHPAWGDFSVAICSDIRFPHLFRKLAHSGATILTIPAAFSPVTGKAHWEPLLRARAIENGAFVLAPGQCGHHSGKRHTHGHSLAIAPWGEVLADGGDAPGVTLLNLELTAVNNARTRVPSLTHDRSFTGPE